MVFYCSLCIGWLFGMSWYVEHGVGFGEQYFERMFPCYSAAVYANTILYGSFTKSWMYMLLITQHISHVLPHAAASYIAIWLDTVHAGGR